MSEAAHKKVEKKNGNVVYSYFSEEIIMSVFSKRKYLSLSLESQHKKCAELLRYAYEDFEEASDEIRSTYNGYQQWMGGEMLVEWTRECIADRYHYHLLCADLSIREHNLLPRVTTWDRVSAEPALPVSIYLDNIRSAYNIGSIIRTTEALSLGTIFFAPGMAGVDNKQVRDTAMGAAEWVTCHANATLDDLPPPVCVLETIEGATPVSEFSFPDGPFTLAIGNEEYGCSSKTIHLADHTITIPLHGRKNSLNVANAFAIIAHEISKQKRNRSIHKKTEDSEFAFDLFPPPWSFATPRLRKNL